LPMGNTAMIVQDIGQMASVESILLTKTNNFFEAGVDR
jgi:hypothetical protein